MKKIFSIFCYAILAMTAVSFYSCDKEECEDEYETQTEETPRYARLVASVSDNILEYGDIVLTLKGNQINKECRLSKGKAVDSLAYKVFESFEEDEYPGKIAGHEVEIPVFECTKDSLIVTSKFELSEAGKQKMANAKPGEEEDFACELDFGLCTKDGIFISGDDDGQYFRGIGVAEFEAFVESFIPYFTKELVIK